MSQIVDTLVTRYTLDASGYKKGADDVKKSTKGAADSIKSLKDTAGKLSSSFSGISSSFSDLQGRVMGVVGTVLKFGAVAATALIGLATYAVNAAVEMDTLKRRLVGVTGDAAKAARLWEVVKKLAQDSMFETGPVAEAAIMLEAFGVSAEKWTKLAVVMGSAFGGTADKLADFVAILGRLKGGQISEALGPDGLGRFGVSREVLRQFGAVFDKNGAFVGSAEEAMAIIERVVKEKFGAIAASMEGGPMAKLASFWDSVKFAAAEAGAVILTALLPHVEQLTNLFSWLVSSGVITDITTKLVGLFNIGSGQSPLVYGVLLLISSVYELANAIPELVKRFSVGMDSIKDAIALVATLAVAGFAIAVVQAVSSAIVALMALGEVLALIISEEATALTMTIVGIAAVVAAVAAGVMLFKALRDQLDKVGMSIKGLTGGLVDPSRIAKRADDWSKQVGAPAPMAPSDIGQALSEQAGVQQALNQIAGNTAATATNTQKALDMQRYVLGGGDLGRLGVTPVEISGGRSREVRIKVDTGDGGLDEWVEKLLNRGIRELKRRGQL